MAYMNVGRGHIATHDFLERCARDSVGVVFVGECWVERRRGRGTQLHPDYVRLVSLSKAHRVTSYVLQSMVDASSLVECANRFVCLEIEGVQIGGVYGHYGERVYDMERWLEGICEVVGVGHWVLLGD